MFNKTCFISLFTVLSLSAQIAQQFTGSYGANAVQQFSVWFPNGVAQNDPSLPIVVYFHGGGWKSGNGFDDPSLDPTNCLNAATAVCALAAQQGYAVYRFDYTLTMPGAVPTQWPAQWQDSDCMLKFLAEQAGVSVPGDPHKIVLWGMSAGAQLALVTGMISHSSFQPNCSHANTNYTVLGIVATSPPLDLSRATSANPDVVQLLGCDPSQGNPQCIAQAASASPVSYAAQGLPIVFVQSGVEDTKIPYVNQSRLMLDLSALSPPVFSAWEVFGGANGHTLDVDYSPTCAKPCGSQGRAYATLAAFLKKLFILGVY